MFRKIYSGMLPPPTISCGSHRKFLKRHFTRLWAITYVSNNRDWEVSQPSSESGPWMPMRIDGRYGPEAAGRKAAWHIPKS